MKIFLTKKQFNWYKERINKRKIKYLTKDGEYVFNCLPVSTKGGTIDLRSYENLPEKCWLDKWRKIVRIHLGWN